MIDIVKESFACFLFTRSRYIYINNNITYIQIISDNNSLSIEISILYLKNSRKYIINDISMKIEEYYFSIGLNFNRFDCNFVAWFTLQYTFVGKKVNSCNKWLSCAL